MPDISIGRILREPLFHFFLLGLGVFAIYDTGAPNGQNGGDGAQIVIDRQDVDRLVQQFEATWRRPPTQEELSALVEAQLREEILVREAIAHAIDRQAIIDGAMFGLGTPIGTHFAPHHPDYVDLTGISQYDPDLAKTLLAQAGFPDGFKTTLKLPPPSYARRGGEIIAAQLRAVGIETEISTLEWAQWLEQVFRGKDFGLTIVSHTEPFDIGIYARPEYYFQYDNPDFQALNAALMQETNPAERSDLMVKMQRMISEDYVNGYLFQLATPTVANAKLRGLWKDAPTQATDLTGVYWEE